jgi:hypothetical protein
MSKLEGKVAVITLSCSFALLKVGCVFTASWLLGLQILFST